MIYIIKEDEVCIKTRSTSASFAPATVKWTIENNNSNNEINIKINKRNLIYSRTPLFHSLNHKHFYGITSKKYFPDYRFIVKLWLWLVRSAKKAFVRVILLVAAHKCSHSQNSSKACKLYSALHKGETCKDPHNNALALSIWDNLCERKSNK